MATYDDTLKVGYKLARRLGLSRREFMSLVGLALGSAAARAQDPPEPDPEPGPNPDSDPESDPEEDSGSNPNEGRRGWEHDNDCFGNEPETLGTGYKEYFQDLKQWIEKLQNDSSSEQDGGETTRVEKQDQKSISDDSTQRGSLPSPATSGDTIFERIHRAYERQFSDTRNDAASERLADLACKIAKEETSAWKASKESESGKWAKETERGPYKAGDWKCNVAIAEWTTKEGARPLYTKDGSFANTKYMLDRKDSFTCWRTTDDPKKGDIGVYPNHAFVVIDPKTGEGVSALRNHTKNYQHFERDAQGVAHPVVFERDSRGVSHAVVDKEKEVIFFEYHCPDHQVHDNFLYDKVPTGN
jgi:hypothetical protein